LVEEEVQLEEEQPIVGPEVKEPLEEAQQPINEDFQHEDEEEEVEETVATKPKRPKKYRKNIFEKMVRRFQRFFGQRRIKNS